MKSKIFSVLRLILAPFKFLLLAGAALGLMAYTNYTVDCSGLYQGDLVNRTIVELLLAGENVTSYSQMNDAAVLALYAQLVDADQMPDVVALGSSRVMQLTADTVGQNFFNCGMSGGDYRDMLNQYYSFVKNGKIPKAVILGVDPWLFRADALSKKSDETLYAEACAVALGYETDYVPPVDSKFYTFSAKLVENLTGGKTTLPGLNITSITLPALFEPAYFQGNVAHYRQNKDDHQITAAVGDKTVTFAPLADADLDAYNDEARLADGSVWYGRDFRNQTEDEILVTANAHAGTFLHMLDYTALDKDMCARFEDMVAYMQACGSQVYFFLSPYHPHTYQYQIYANFASTRGFFQVEPYVRALGQKLGIPVIGSYSADMLGLEGLDFFDGLHVRTDAIRTFFGGLDAAGNVLPGTETAHTDLAVNEKGVVYNTVTGALDAYSQRVN